MANFKGYYIKINGCTFQNPSLKREGFKYAPNLIQVTNSGTLASGKVTFKVLPHSRKKIWCSFPPLTKSQLKTYWAALKGDELGPGMNLTVEVYNNVKDTYETDTFYHNDLIYTPITYGGEKMYVLDDFELIGK